MTPDASAWLSQVPVVPLGVAVMAAGLWFLASLRTKKARAALQAKLDAGALVVDVRSSQEFGQGHYSGAVNHPVDALEKSLKKLGTPDRPIIVHCASGARSARAAQILRQAGFTDVTDAGGLANLPK